MAKTRGRPKDRTPFVFKYLKRYYANFIIVALLIGSAAFSGVFYGMMMVTAKDQAQAIKVKVKPLTKTTKTVTGQTVERAVEDVINECYLDRYSAEVNYTIGTADVCNKIMDMLNKLCNQTEDKIFSKCDSKLLSKYIGDENL